MKRIVCITTALLALAAVGPVARADDGAEGRTHTIVAHFEDPGTSAVTPVCDPANPSLCDFAVDGGAVFSGDVEGPTHYRAMGHFNPAVHGEEFVIHETFTGTFVGCGRGTVQWTVRGVVNDKSAEGYDPVTGTVPMDNQIDINPGTGTGGLRGMTGHIHGIGRLNPVTFENWGDWHGVVTCSPAPDSGKRHPH